MVHQQSSNVIFVITIILIKSSLVLGNKPEHNTVYLKAMQFQILCI